MIREVRTRGRTRRLAAALSCLGAVLLTGCQADADITVNSDLSMSGTVTVAAPASNRPSAKKYAKQVQQTFPISSASCKPAGGGGSDTVRITCSWPATQLPSSPDLRSQQGVRIARENGDIVFRSWRRLDPRISPPGSEDVQLRLTVTMPTDITAVEVNGETVTSEGPRTTVTFDPTRGHDVIVRSSDPTSNGSETGGEEGVSTPILFGGIAAVTLALGASLLYLRRRY